ncbi:CHY zinc finger protein [Aquibacillus albus]|uniref:CHY-type Zn-finger protein n=1 Tax=Aquibacillus albus TaxID=1168171 RepID=A0ABS2N2G0_9BACI|nr:CHY zinc finger protein [Aquibacillus albus]MBM7572281.1 putative CHY-type Zn-finger protein [Aquibacillus albus]
MEKELKVHGSIKDNQTRCTHYHGQTDIIAIKFACCNRYYPCYKCHEESEGHPIQTWKQSDFHQKAILCGNCKTELRISEYLNCNNRCLRCSAPFNPGCSNHYHYYFQL